MPLFRALAKNMAASYFGKKAPYGFVMEVTLLYVFILWFGRIQNQSTRIRVMLYYNAIIIRIP
jgi:hypothetical protein